MDSEGGHFKYVGQLKGHGGWVTSIAAPADENGLLLSGSRDGSVMQWRVEAHADETGSCGEAVKRMDGHSNFVQDVQISSDGQYGLSASWDGTLRLWDLKSGNSPCRFVGHTKDAMSCAFSPDNRQILSGARDNCIKMWNTLGQEKFNIGGANNAHTDWISCARFSPNPQNSVFVTGSWDKSVKVWNGTDLSHMFDLVGHTGVVNSVTMSPDGSLCASGGKDGNAILWDLNKGEELYSLEGQDNIHCLTFSPNRYWLCAATGSSIKIWDLESKHTVAELVPELPEMSAKAMKPECISLAWSADGSTLYSGYTDNTIRVWGVHGN